MDSQLPGFCLTLPSPTPAIYHKAMELVQRKPEECLMVAAHAYDLRAAKAVYVSSKQTSIQTSDRPIPVVCKLPTYSGGQKICVRICSRYDVTTIAFTMTQREIGDRGWLHLPRM